MTHRDEILRPTAEVVIEALRNTAELIEQGHCKGQAHAVIDDRDCWCIMAALTKSCHTVVVYIERMQFDSYRVDRGVIPGKAILDRAVGALRMAMSANWSGTLAEFNDVSSTDAVLNACVRAIGMIQTGVHV